MIRGARQWKTAAVILVLLGPGLACRTRPAPAPEPSPMKLPIMGRPRLSAEQLIEWFTGRQPQPEGRWSAAVGLDSLASYFIEEGVAEGVAGDVAFVQAIVETGWFRFQGSVSPASNNFSGLGAVDGTSGRAAEFPDPRTGVRAQIQHLRAYADSRAVTCSAPPLANPCVDPRFELVMPRGKAPFWNDLGHGNWASNPRYGETILVIYREALAWVSSKLTGNGTLY